MNLAQTVAFDTRSAPARTASDVRGRHWLLLGLLSVSLHAAVYRALSVPRETIEAPKPKQIEIQLVAAPLPAPPPPSPPVPAPPPPVIEAPPPPPPKPAPKPQPKPKPMPKPRPEPAPEPPPTVVEAPPVPSTPRPAQPTAPSVAAIAPVEAPREPVYVAPVPVGEVQPNFPLLARRRGWEGTVVVRFQVDTAGEVANVEVAKSSGRQVFDDEAIRAVKRRPFRPATRDGVAVAAQHTIRITFKLKD